MSCSSVFVTRCVAVLVGDHDRAVGLHLGLLGARRLPIDVDVLDVDLVRLVVVGVEPIAEPVEVRLLVVDRELHRRVEPLQNLERSAPTG